MTSDGAQANNDPASDGVRALSHAGASTSAPTAPSDEGPKPVKKKKEKRRAVEVVAKDFERLEALEFLNDTCIDFYLRHVEEHLPACMKERCPFFNSFFYKKLAEKVVKGKGKAAPSVMVPVGGRVEHCDLDFLEDDDEEISPDSNTRLKNAKDKHKVNHERVSGSCRSLAMTTDRSLDFSDSNISGKELDQGGGHFQKGLYLHPYPRRAPLVPHHHLPPRRHRIRAQVPPYHSSL